MEQNNTQVRLDITDDLLLQYKYMDVLRRLTKGTTHEYSNIFTGLSGLMRIKKHETDGCCISTKRTHLIEELIRRGQKQTEMISEISCSTERTEKPTSPTRLAIQAIEILNTISKSHRFSIQVKNKVAKINVRRRDIILMLFYLGENAIDAMEDGGEIKLEVSQVEHHSHPSFIQFSLIDSGTGFSDAIRPYMCRPLFTTRHGKSLHGIGLYAAKTIVTNHGGSFDIKNGAGGGAIATVNIPALQNGEKNTEKQSISSVISHSEKSSRKHVFLVVDDEEAQRDYFLHCLQRRGHAAICVESCSDALREFSLHLDTVTVIVIDVGLMDISGYECVHQLRKISANVPVIMMSGNEIDQETVLDSNTKFIMKPVTLKQLEQLVSDVNF